MSTEQQDNVVTICGARPPWTIKGVDPAARQAIIDAAREAGVTQGEWISRAMLGTTKSAAGPVASPAPAPYAIGEIEQAFSLAERLKGLSDQPLSAELMQALDGRLCQVISSM